MALRVIWKDEDEIDGTRVGPVRVIQQSDETTGNSTMRPYDPNRQPDPWMTKQQALLVAERYGVALEEV